MTHQVDDKIVDWRFERNREKQKRVRLLTNTAEFDGIEHANKKPRKETTTPAGGCYSSDGFISIPFHSIPFHSIHSILSNLIPFHWSRIQQNVPLDPVSSRRLLRNPREASIPTCRTSGRTWQRRPRSREGRTRTPEGNDLPCISWRRPPCSCDSCDASPRSAAAAAAATKGGGGTTAVVAWWICVCVCFYRPAELSSVDV